MLPVFRAHSQEKSAESATIILQELPQGGTRMPGLHMQEKVLHSESRPATCLSRVPGGTMQLKALEPPPQNDSPFMRLDPASRAPSVLLVRTL